MGKNYRNSRKVSRTPRRPYEKERLESEIKLAGKFGLRCKREIWRLNKKVMKIRKSASEMLTLEPNDPRRVFQGEALVRRLRKMKLLKESSALDDVLNLKVEDLLERSLQTLVYRQGMAKSTHHSRVLIRQRQIAVKNKLVNVPSFAVNKDSESQIIYTENSFMTNPDYVGRTKRKNLKNKKDKGGNGEEDDI